MTSVTFTPDVGGDDITIDDSDSATTGLANGGHRTRFMIALQQMMKVAQWVKGTATTVLSYRDAAATSASQAQNFAAAAQAAAGAPAIVGKANKYLRVNPTETGVLWDDQKDWTAEIEAAIKAHLPATIISIHSGSVASIPPTWKLCDGTNGTIDLRDKFVLGAGTGGPAVGATGGAKTVALSEAQMPSHAHAGTTNGAGSHAHSAWSDTQGWHQHGVGGDQPMQPTGAWSYRNAGGSGSAMSSGDGAHSHNIGVGAVGDHAHSFATDYRGSGQAHENMPPYYALCFIQKVWPT